MGITFSESELQDLFDSFKWQDNSSDTVTHLEIFSNAHLFHIQQLLSGLRLRIAIGCGAGLT